MRNHILKVGGLIAVSFLLWGCGGQPLKTKAVSGQTFATGSTTTSTGTTATSSSATSASIGVAPLSYVVSGIGYTTTSVTVQTRTILKLTFTPGLQQSSVAGTGVYPQYSKLGVYIGTNQTNLQPTEMLTNGFDGTAAVASHIFDLSSQFHATCAADDTSCSQTVTILVGKPNNDFYCLNYGAYCNWAQMYATHPWNGILTIQTDNTDALPDAD